MSDKIVYYSLYGNSKLLAECLQEKKNSSILRILQDKERKGVVGFIKRGAQASMKKKVHLLEDPWSQIVDDKKIYLISPINAGNIAPAMRSFIIDANFEGKEVVGVFLQADPKTGAEIEEDFNELVKNAKGTVIKLYKFHGSAPGKVREKSYFEKLAEDIQ